MSSFQELQELFLLSYENGIIDNNGFLVLHEEIMPKNPDFSYEEHDRFSLEEMIVSNFRPDIISNDLHGIKFYPKNTSESLHVDSNQKKMKYSVIFQFVNLFNFLLLLTSKFHRDKSGNRNVITNDFYAKLAVESS